MVSSRGCRQRSRAHINVIQCCKRVIYNALHCNWLANGTTILHPSTPLVVTCNGLLSRPRPSPCPLSLWTRSGRCCPSRGIRKEQNMFLLSMVVLVRSFAVGPRPSSKHATTPRYARHYELETQFLARVVRQ